MYLKSLIGFVLELLSLILPSIFNTGCNQKIVKNHISHFISPPPFLPFLLLKICKTLLYFCGWKIRTISSPRSWSTHFTSVLFLSQDPSRNTKTFLKYFFRDITSSAIDVTPQNHFSAILLFDQVVKTIQNILASFLQHFVSTHQPLCWCTNQKYPSRIPVPSSSSLWWFSCWVQVLDELVFKDSKNGAGRLKC